VSADQSILSKAGRGNPQRALMLLIGLPITAFLAFGVALALDYPRDRYGMIGMALLTMVVALIPVILDQARPAERRHILLTLYCLLFIGHFCLPIFTQYAIVTMPTDPPGVTYADLFPADVMAGQTVALIGLVSFLLGYALLPSQLSDQDIERRKSRDWSPVVILIVGVMMLVLGLVFTVSRTLGLIPAVLGSGVTSTIASSIIFGNVLLTVAALRNRSRVAWIMLFIAVPISTVLGFFTGSKRAALIFPAVVFFTSMLLGGRLRARWIVVGTMTLALLYPASEFYREDILQNYTLTIVEALSDPTYTLGVLSDFFSSSRPGRYLSDGLVFTAARIDGVGIESVIVRDTPSVSPFQRGRTLGLFFVAFVPRLLWPSKPEITLGQWITDTYGSGPQISSYTGPTFIGDLYLNFGVASVVIGMLLIGALLRLFQTRFLGPHPTAVGILAVIIVIAQFHIKQIGSAANVMASTVFALAPLFLVYIAVPYFVRGKAPPTVPNWSEQVDSGSDSAF